MPPMTNVVLSNSRLNHRAKVSAPFLFLLILGLSSRPTSGTGVKVTTVKRGSSKLRNGENHGVKAVGKEKEGGKKVLAQGQISEDSIRSVRWVETLFSDPHRQSAEVEALQEELKQQRELSSHRIQV